MRRAQVLAGFLVDELFLLLAHDCLELLEGSHQEHVGSFLFNLALELVERDARKPRAEDVLAVAVKHQVFFLVLHAGLRRN